MDDSTWLRAYAEHGSEQAFTRLVERHMGLVYSAALRRVRDHHLAEEVTQAVFVTLAKRAARLKRETVLSVWLRVPTRFIALDQVRAPERRARTRSSTRCTSAIHGCHAAYTPTGNASSPCAAASASMRGGGMAATS